MKIGFDAKRLFNNYTGLGNYSRTLVSGLSKVFPEHKLYLFTPKKKFHPETRVFFNEPFIVETPKTKFKNIWRTFTSTRTIKKNKLDIYHGLSHELPVGIKKTGVKSVVTIHDLIYKTYPNDFSLIDRMIYNFKFTYACKNADKIIAVSESTKNDIIKFYKVPSEKVEVIYQSCHPQFKVEQEPNTINSVLKTYNLPDEFMLYVGSIIERKNLLNLVKAIEILENKTNLPLVIVGKGKSYLLKVQSYVAKIPIKDRIYFAPPIAFNDLPVLYQKASLFIYPSVYEGFGIPVIEALWSKTPVVTSNISSMPEAAGPGALLCDPTKPESIAENMLKILELPELAKKLVDDGFEYIQKFENEPTTQQLENLYQQLLNA